MNELLDLRKRLGLSQSELGSILGVGQSAISQCERGGNYLSIKHAKRLIKLAAEKGVAVTLDELYRTEEDPA
ncbi:helix-turn-helix domain-containing protein [Cupriavidus basilensis]|uniref:helix-turn-helix domain-containing protein n=1 Tax=Cupriavidus basilensis TaxID=68895 RepID=UPI0020A66F86|nr:helix-turn-helix transcriptional regulator [Cupriavidus basilensis]MCP3022280.1 helix-turn-helix domain-containing protein [Cupriavidus basilensis]